MKRKRGVDGLEDQENRPTSTPKKSRSEQKRGVIEDIQKATNIDSVTPSRKARGRPPGSKSKTKDVPDSAEVPTTSTPTPGIKGKLLFTTPRTTKQDGPGENTPQLVRNADRSARRKSARTLIERTIAGDVGDEDELEEEDLLARRIWEEDDSGNEDLIAELDEGPEIDPDAPDTPSKSRTGPRKKTRRKRSPTPPRNLPSHEQYFFQNRTGSIKTSNNTFSSISLLSHEDYFNHIESYVDPHDSEKLFLQELHSRSFGQWQFELSENFNICVYGWGSKRHLITRFAEYLYLRLPEKPPDIVVVNGYVPTLNIRTILTTIATVILGPKLPAKMGAQPAEILDTIIGHLSGLPALSPKPLVIIHSLDAYSLRRGTTQSLLARLASDPHISLLASCDTPNFPLLWDSSLTEQYNFLFHDCTTFAPYDAEISVVDDVHELLGRSGRRVGGKEGVGFVLKSLPENARNLYRVLIGEQLTAMDSGIGTQGAGDDDADEGEADKTGGGDGEGGVDYRFLYQKAVEEFICSSEMSFRTLLKEFHDHQMITSKKDVLGTEVLSVPFRREEMEVILEDLMG